MKSFHISPHFYMVGWGWHVFFFITFYFIIIIFFNGAFSIGVDGFFLPCQCHKLKKTRKQTNKQTSWKGVFSSLTGRSGSPVLSDSLNLRNRTGETRRRQTFRDKRENNCLKRPSVKLLDLFSRSFC